jgi:hypothetical protein
VGWSPRVAVTPDFRALGKEKEKHRITQGELRKRGSKNALLVYRYANKGHDFQALRVR